MTLVLTTIYVCTGYTVTTLVATWAGAANGQGASAVGGELGLGLGDKGGIEEDIVGVRV